MTYPPTALPIFAATVPAGSVTVRRLTWIAINWVAIVVIGLVVVRTWGTTWPLPVRLAFVLVVAACKPTRAGIALGQFHLIPTALIVVAEAVAAKRWWLSGCLAGLSLTKPTMSVPYLFVMAARRRWRALIVAIGLQAALLAIVSGWLATDPVMLIREWLKNARSQLAYGTIDVPSLLGRAVPSLAGSTPVATLAILVVAIVLITVFRDRSALGLTSLATFAAAVMTYHRHYDLVLLLPTLAYLIDRGCRGRTGASWAAALFGALLVVPSDGRVVGATVEAVYDIAFLVVCYAILGMLVREVAAEPVKSASGPALT
jgi:Glycosyltransferase family 87